MAQKVLLPMPPDGEEFELIINGNARKNQPLEMLRRAGYPGKWKYIGELIAGTQTRRFKWAAVGHQQDDIELRDALARQGKFPRGQWLNAVIASYRPDVFHHRGVLDRSWVHPDGFLCIPIIESGKLVLTSASREFNEECRWLVEVE